MNTTNDSNIVKQRNLILTGAKESPAAMGFPEMVVNIEGGKSNHPNDHGGLTMYGITLPFYYDVLLHYNPRLTGEEIKAKFAKLTAASARGIYSMYFRMIVADRPELYAAPTGLLAHYLDVCVNSHAKRATLLLQRVLQLHEDGIWGPQTAAALAAAINDPEAAKLLKIRYARARYNFYRDICKNDPSQTCFLNGWINRIEKVNKYANNFVLECAKAGV